MAQPFCIDRFALQIRECFVALAPDCVSLGCGNSPVIPAKAGIHQGPAGHETVTIHHSQLAFRKPCHGATGIRGNVSRKEYGLRSWNASTPFRAAAPHAFCEDVLPGEEFQSSARQSRHRKLIGTAEHYDNHSSNAPRSARGTYLFGRRCPSPHQTAQQRCRERPLWRSANEWK